MAERIATTTYNPDTMELTAAFNSYGITKGPEETVTLTVAPHSTGDAEQVPTTKQGSGVGVLALHGLYFEDVEQVLPRVREAVATDSALKGAFVLEVVADDKDLHPQILASRDPKIGAWDERSIQGLAALFVYASFAAAQANLGVQTLQQYA